jgi:hypothetical protein
LPDPPASAQASPTERATSATNAIHSFLIARLLKVPAPIRRFETDRRRRGRA